MTAARPISLLSCCARYASVILPAYSVEADEQPAFDPRTRMFECICGLSAKQVLDECVRTSTEHADDSGRADWPACTASTRPTRWTRCAQGPRSARSRRNERDFPKIDG